MSDNRVGDLHRIETADGNVLTIDRPVFFPVYGGYGMPPTSFQTRSGYKQDGSTEIDFQLRPRRISVQLYHESTQNRQVYWDNRERLLNFLRPNRGGPLTLTIRQPNGDQRSIVVRGDPGLTFPPTPAEENAWNISEDLEFIAFDPIWFDASETTLAVASAVDTQLVFPITFPITFGTSGLQFNTGNINYAGSWKSYPQITIEGPYTSATLIQLTLDVKVFLNVPIIAGQTRAVDFTPGAQQVVDGNNVNKFAELGPGSNLVDFYLAPDPEAQDGINQLSVILLGGSAGVSAVTVTYKTRYVGI